VVTIRIKPGYSNHRTTVTVITLVMLQCYGGSLIHKFDASGMHIVGGKKAVSLHHEEIRNLKSSAGIVRVLKATLVRWWPGRVAYWRCL
jgi:hypothetical protein